jgi:uncharacterized protein (TIGR02594 family)
MKEEVSMKDGSRRSFLTETLAILVASRMARLVAQTPAPQGVSENYRDFFSGEIPNLELFGTNTPKGKEVEHADTLLISSPQNRTPLDVLRYLAAITDLNDDQEEYRGGWRDRWNPVIVRFFTETQTKPSGDTTPWCAACVNWCIARSGMSGTNSASSGSFRNAPGKTEKPRPGDIVVFKSSDPAKASVGHGHVGLFLEQDEKRINVLGGNQVNKMGHHKMCEEWIGKNDDGGTLIFHSFHSIAAFPATPRVASRVDANQH